jgi:NAD(P)-dependent dehydrogenase (short-subunit alcohol dehydrogenase family)
MSKVAVVTGGAGGIGQAVAERFAQDGSRILLLDVNAQSGNRVAAALLERGAETAFFPIDLTQELEVQAIFERIVAAHKASTFSSTSLAEASIAIHWTIFRFLTGAL